MQFSTRKSSQKKFSSLECYVVAAKTAYEKKLSTLSCYWIIGWNQVFKRAFMQRFAHCTIIISRQKNALKSCSFLFHDFVYPMNECVARRPFTSLSDKVDCFLLDFHSANLDELYRPS